MLHAPALSCNSASILRACFMNTFLVEVGLDITPSKVASSCLSKDVFAAMLDEEAVNTLEIIYDRM